MPFRHEELDVYQLALKYVAFAFELSGRLEGSVRHARDQLLRASQSIPLNIAEGNGKASEGDRRRFFEIARGSALECAAIQDVLQVCDAITAEENADAKQMLDRIAAMLTKLGGRGYSVGENVEEYDDHAD
jgi:four helix bundle protein